jgi:hypothetical protein
VELAVPLVVEASVAVSEEASLEVRGRLPAINAVDPTISLATARPRQ